jgi:GT2 family glycosyltransferase
MEHPGPRTSFVIATRDRAVELAGTLHRLLDTTSCPIIVVDNASQDDSCEVTRAISRDRPDGDRVRLIPLTSNQGAVARNVGVAASHTPYVAFCDDDSWWRPDATTIAEEQFDRNAELALLAARTVVEPGGRTDAFSDLLADSPLGRLPGLPGPLVLGFQSCSAVVRKSAFESAGGFSPVLHFRGEEQLLALDLAVTGWRLCYCPAIVAFHQPSPRRQTPAAQRARVLRNDFLTSCMRRPPSMCLARSAPLLRAAAHDRAHLRAAAEAVARLPAALRNRRVLPPEWERQVRLLEAVSN